VSFRSVRAERFAGDADHGWTSGATVANIHSGWFGGGFSLVLNTRVWKDTVIFGAAANKSVRHLLVACVDGITYSTAFSPIVLGDTLTRTRMGTLPSRVSSDDSSHSSSSSFGIPAFDVISSTSIRYQARSFTVTPLSSSDGRMLSMLTIVLRSTGLR
jgi:hypothetical protein